MSLKIKITISFIFTIILIIGGNIWFNIHYEKKIQEYLSNYYLDTAKKILIHIDDKEMLNKILKENDLNLMKNKFLDEHQFTKIKHLNHSFGEVNILKYKDEDNDEDDIFCYIKYLDKEILIQKHFDDLDEREIINNLLYLAIFVLLLLYFYIMSLLMPISKATQMIKEFSNGNFNIKLSYKNKDEIGELVSSFNTMGEKISYLISSKNAILRDIGHELQTPITKCKFALENIESSKDKTIINNSLNQLNSLIQIILRLEHIENKDLEFNKFSVETLLTETLSNIHIDNENDIEINLNKDFFILGDIFYLSIALKNLIENGLKYKTKGNVCIEINDKKLSVINFGKKLNNNIAFYKKAFNQDKENLQKGYGIGLSIVDKVLKKHKFKFEYEYKEEKNIFSIIFN